MFWGTILKEGKPFNLAEQDLDSPVLCVSNAVIVNPDANQKTTLIAKVTGKEHVIAYFQKDKMECY